MSLLFLSMVENFELGATFQRIDDSFYPASKIYFAFPKMFFFFAFIARLEMCGIVENNFIIYFMRDNLI